MTSRPWITLATALVAAVVLTGCTEQSAGSPLPDDTVANTVTESDTTEPTTGSEPSSERPSEIRLDNTDPCALIPQTDWTQFGIERPGIPGIEPNIQSPDCTYPGVGQVTTVVTEGIEAWTNGSRNVEIEHPEPIEGFPTVTLANNIDLRACYAAVDVADGQYLMTTATPDPDDPALPERCDFAYQMAESAMKVLVAS